MCANLAFWLFFGTNNVLLAVFWHKKPLLLAVFWHKKQPELSPTNTSSRAGVTHTHTHTLALAQQRAHESVIKVIPKPSLPALLFPLPRPTAAHTAAAAPATLSSIVTSLAAEVAVQHTAKISPGTRTQHTTL